MVVLKNELERERESGEKKRSGGNEQFVDKMRVFYRNF